MINRHKKNTGTVSSMMCCPSTSQLDNNVRLPGPSTPATLRPPPSLLRDNFYFVRYELILSSPFTTCACSFLTRRDACCLPISSYLNTTASGSLSRDHSKSKPPLPPPPAPHTKSSSHYIKKNETKIVVKKTFYW